jgi:AP-3 complex subunit sigma
VFVEALDKCFENVCELDLIFHSDKVRDAFQLRTATFDQMSLRSLHMQVHFILDEIIMGGMVLDTNINNILTSINEQNKLHSASQKMSLSVTAATPAKEGGSGGTTVSIGSVKFSIPGTSR